MQISVVCLHSLSHQPQPTWLTVLMLQVLEEFFMLNVIICVYVLKFLFSVHYMHGCENTVNNNENCGSY